MTPEEEDALLDQQSQRRLQIILRSLGGLVVAGGIAFVLALSLYLYRFAGPLSDSQATWGVFGDYMGGTLNPILTFLTLLALLATIVLQAQELHLSTKELRQSSRALRSQSSTLQVQQFENAFFQLLNLHNSIVNNLETRDQHHAIVRGRDCFRVFVDEFRRTQEVQTEPLSLDSLRGSYGVFYQNKQHQVGHYFRLLYNIVKFVDNAPVKDKKFYTNLVRAQLSADELTLLFWNCLSRWGEERFKPLVERYSLLKTLPARPYFPTHVRGYYDPKAYEGSSTSR
jgi:hypothetical protein